MRQSQQTYFEAKARQNRRKHLWRLFRNYLPLIALALLALAQFLFPNSTATMMSLASAPDRSAEAYYPNCDAARSAGVAPITEGEPGYRQQLDADDDGIACEPYRHWR